MHIDTSFDFNSETPKGRDADTASPTLQSYHQFLWSKPLPSGRALDLIQAKSSGRRYLVHDSDLGRFELSSDAITNRLRNSAAAKSLGEDERPPNLGYTIGSSLVFPRDRRDGKQTINQQRGTHARIKDRFDLTLECIRRHYTGGSSPLQELLARYADFFRLFESFDDYVEFFLLQDLVGNKLDVQFFHPFDDFRSPAVPKARDDYLAYVLNSNSFIVARNARIADWSAAAD